MADDVDITAGAGTKVKTDEVAVNGGAAGHVQFVKLVDGTANGADGLPGSAANGLTVDVTRVVPGVTATALGKSEDTVHADGDTGVMMLGVRDYAGAGSAGDYSALSVASDGSLRVSGTAGSRNVKRIPVNSAGLTIATTAYSLNDQLGTQLTFADAATSTGGTGLIVGCTVTDVNDIVGAIDLAIFRSSVALGADNAAFGVSDADALNLVALIQLGNITDLGGNRFLQAFNLSIPYDCSGTSLFGALITRSGHTFFTAVTDLQTVLYVERN